jgi:homoserine dehydrogenase
MTDWSPALIDTWYGGNYSLKHLHDVISRARRSDAGCLGYLKRGYYFLRYSIITVRRFDSQLAGALKMLLKRSDELRCIDLLLDRCAPQAIGSAPRILEGCMMLPVVVLKFGSSVLKSPKDLPAAVDEVYRRLRPGPRVLAVVSAFAGDTDRLIERATAVLGADAAPEAVAAYVATGEVQSAALLVGACLRAGVAARQVDPREIRLRVVGSSLEADPVSVNPYALRALWEVHTTLVLPGFFGIDAQGRVALLGRGGSDLSALFLANAFMADCHLIKDVSGVFDRDPAMANGAARRYALIPWRAASAVAGPLIQPKALEYAANRRIRFSVGRPNGALDTRIAEAPVPVFGVSDETPVPLKVALLGFGTVGRGVYERLVAHPALFELAHVVTRRPAKAVANGLAAPLASSELDRALAREIDLVIECIGGIEPAGSVIEAALAMGKTVVSANKAAIAAYWTEFSSFTREPRRRLWFSAAVGGAVPVLETLAGLGDQVREVRGVINGTCNFVLDALARGEDFEAAVRAAQDAGFAEPDPSRDLGGEDSADKLRLIAHTAFGMHHPLMPFEVLGIDARLVCDKTHLWRHVARAVRVNGTVSLSVAPQWVLRDSFLGQTTGVENRLEVVLKDDQVVRLAGQGAGRWPTTTAVMADVLEVARRRQDLSAVRTSDRIMAL